MTKTYLIDTDCFLNNNLYEQYYKNMALERQKKISRLIPLGSKRLSLGAGVALSKALEDFGLHEKNAEIKYNEKGKPFLKTDAAHISISHSGHYAVVSISPHEVGVDIEEIKPIEDGVIKRVTTLSEQAQIKSLKDFYRLWTAKECILKITGDGLGGGMENIDLHIEEDTISIITAPVKKRLYFQEYKIPNFCLTVCNEENNFTQEVETITP